jgi:hypothetical protein
MEAIKLTQHVGSDGVLRLELPIGRVDVDCEVVITIPTKMTKAAWLAIVEETAGSLADDPIKRLPQGQIKGWEI